MRNGLTLLIVASACSLGVNTCHAQYSVQQPVFSTFSGGTTVSVPDGGRTSIGSIGRAGASRSRYGIGPTRSGSNLGVFNESAGMSVGVRIHDLAELDRQVLAAAESRSSRTREKTTLPPQAERAYKVLSRRPPERNRGSLGPVVVR